MLKEMYKQYIHARKMSIHSKTDKIIMQVIPRRAKDLRY